MPSCDQDRLLRGFLASHDLKYSVQGNEFGNGPRTFTVTVQPRYLDETERHVVEFCEKNKIKYKFYSTDDDMHHYEFETGIFFHDEPAGEYMVDIRAPNRQVCDAVKEDMEMLHKWQAERDKWWDKTSFKPTRPKPKNWREKLTYKVKDLWATIASLNPKRLAAEREALNKLAQELKQSELKVTYAQDSMLALSGIVDPRELN